MDKTLNQRIYETPADIKKAIHDFGYEEGKKAAAEQILADICRIGGCSRGVVLNPWDITELKEKYGVK